MANNFKVLITTSGIGSRLGTLTQFTNKCLITLGDKAVISHIIEKYPSDVTFVVTLGYFGDHVVQYLKLAHPDRNFEFVWVEPFSGTGSSLAFSMYQASAFLQLPFIFHASDTVILDENIPKPNLNWVGGVDQPDGTNYSTFNTISNEISVFHSKGMVEFDFVHIGLVGIYDYQIFWRLLHDCLSDSPFTNDLNDVSVLAKMISTIPLKVVEFKKWLDIGNSNSLKEARKYLVRQLPVLEKHGESLSYVDNKVIKFFSDSKQCLSRVKRADELFGFVPQIEDSTENFFKYNFISGEPLSKSLNPTDIISLLDFALEKFWQAAEIEAPDFEKVSQSFYVDKTDFRLKQYFRTRGLKDVESFINGFRVPRLSSLLPQAFEVLLSDLRPTRFHGDFILDNVIQSEKDFKFIDWRQDFGGSIDAGDIYYDLAKLNHSLVINNGGGIQNRLEVYRSDNQVRVNAFRKDTHVEMQQLFNHWIRKNSFSQMKISVLTAIIWLNMAPLHHHPFDDFLFEYGKFNLWKSLND